MNTKNNGKRLIAVVGATGKQGGAVVRALQASGQFNGRALSRDPSKHRELADEVVEADLNRPETLKAAFEGAHGVFLVTNFSKKKEPTNLSRQQRRCPQLRMPVSNTSFGPHYLTWKQSAVASSTFPTSPARPRLIQSLRRRDLRLTRLSSRLSISRTLQAFWGRKNFQTARSAGLSL